MARVEQVVQLLEERILHGDYRISGWPGEARLAVEIGASRMTTRRAFQRLIDKGHLVRLPTGRLEVKEDAATARRVQVALVTPAWWSRRLSEYRAVLDGFCERFNTLIRPVELVHWDDVRLNEVLNHCDGVFLMPIVDDIPPKVLDRISRAAARVLLLHVDQSGRGIPSMDLCPVRFFQKVFDRFAALGHTRVDCLNTQPLGRTMQLRIEQWKLWRAARDIQGELINEPVEPFHDPVRGAYDLIHRSIAQGQFDSTAIFCTTSATAYGVMRALYEHGIQVGKDVSVSGADDEGDAWMRCPSLTCIQPADCRPYLAAALEWMASGNKGWTGPLLMQPTDVMLFAGESVGPARNMASESNAE